MTPPPPSGITPAVPSDGPAVHWRRGHRPSPLYCSRGVLLHPSRPTCPSDPAHTTMRHRFLSREPPVRYHIYRVSGAGEPAGPKLTIIEDPLLALKEGRVRLCMAI
eukprot:scaffold9993_cov101-Isochrysis_galbana.AAC.13